MAQSCDITLGDNQNDIIAYWKLEAISKSFVGS